MRSAKGIVLFSAAIVAFPIMSLAACEAGEYWPSADWEVARLEERLFRESLLDPLKTFVQEQNSSAFLIIHRGRLETEWYFDGAKPEDRVGSASAAKGFTSALLGIAMEEGYLPGTGTTLADWFPEWTRGDPSGNLAMVTLADLLTMRSVLPWNRDLQVAMHQAPGYLEFIQQQAPEAPPGIRFLYSGFDPILISAIMRRATGQWLADYAQKKLFKPIGIRGATWNGDPKGLTNGGSLINMTARDYARFGLLYLREGRWMDKQVVPAAWVQKSTPNQFDGWPWYGYYWWHLQEEVENSDARLQGCYFAAGAGGQHIIILPALDTVIVRLGTEPKLSPSGGKFVPELCRLLLDSLP